MNSCSYLFSVFICALESIVYPIPSISLIMAGTTTEFTKRDSFSVNKFPWIHGQRFVIPAIQLIFTVHECEKKGARFASVITMTKKYAVRNSDSAEMPGPNKNEDNLANRR
ncbi:hypothetical protein NPIL_487111 [Nephila pilipes]|uniref:Uncharacterized protein n=1 Tax=Nephila pilipes TaxID=299642 RepID=A0A8X6U526_NEPPI|nr:hypothetical protein NPIL_487111 [Nephila pilipes]